ncbi:MAG: cbb3-type cytochrome oxidase assembly protein CcoS [Pseudomonadota bacterium]|jgi:cbb3-type cytochrome oxidase maturation protein
MDILFLLVPVSVLLALAVMGLLAWAVWSGQFEELECEGQRIFLEDELSPALTSTREEA